MHDLNGYKIPENRVLARSFLASLAQDDNSLPRTRLLTNYPNPFHATTTIAFSLSEQANVSINVYDAMGREVRTLVNGALVAGTHRIHFDASELSSGVYYYRLMADGIVETHQLMVLR